MIENVSESRIGKRSLTAKDHWVKLSFKEKYKIEKPTVFCFSGSGDISNKNANGFCKFVENMLTLSYGKPENVEECVDVIGIAYGVTDRGRFIGNLNEIELNNFVVNYILPLCLDEREEKRLPLEDACKNMAKVSFVGFCHGNTEIQNILLNLKYVLPRFGYQQDEIRRIVGSTFCVSYAPETNNRSCPGTSIFSMFDYHNFGSIKDSFEDYENMLGEKVDGILLDIDRPGCVFGREVSVKPERFDFHNIKIMSSKLLNDRNSLGEHSVSILERDKNWNMKHFEDKNADCVSQMMSFAICEAVGNSRTVCETNKYSTVNIRELYKNLCSIENRGFKANDLKDRVR